MEISAPRDWFDLLDALREEKGVAILLGATDTGKSTLAKFLIFNLCQRGLKVALVDADLRQSFLGPPTTIGLAVFKSDPNWEVVLSPPEIFFVGSWHRRRGQFLISPPGNMVSLAKFIKIFLSPRIFLTNYFT